MPAIPRVSWWPIVAVVAVVVYVAFAPVPEAGSSEVVQGDADCSGAVGTADAVAILEHAGSLEEAPCEEAANPNCSGGITAADALLIVRHLADAEAPGGACAAVGDPLGGVTSSIDSGLEPRQDTLPGLSGGPPRDVASSIGPDGVQVDFVADEIIIKPESEEALQEFLDKYNGTVLRDGTEGPGVSVAGTEPVNERYHLVKVDVSTSSTGDLLANLEELGLHGHVRFSDAEAQALGAIVARESENGAAPNIVGQPAVWNEHPKTVDAQGNPTDWFDAETDFSYLTDGSDLSVGVDQAWLYMQYKNMPPQNGSFDLIRIGVIDNGFALSTSTGKPTDGNLDYLYFGAKPVQYDEVGQDSMAGGENSVPCSGGTPCPWHGQSAFGVCCARPHNNYGVAGTGGEVVMPIFVKTDYGMYATGDAIRHIYGMGADIISISSYGDCGFWCDVSTADGNLIDAVESVTDAGTIVLAGAGNEVDDISDREILPCIITRVICVGGIGFDQTNAFNYGSTVDIWAPHFVYSTTTPETLGGNPNKIGLDALELFSGTSSATPFVAGIVGMMKAANPSLNYSEVRSILQSTANLSSDARVSKGYVDALRAVMAVIENDLPTIQITLPFADSTRSYNNVTFNAIVTDADPGAGRDRFTGKTIVEFYGDGVDFICVSNVIVYFGNQPTYQCHGDVLPGTKTIEARVTDPFKGKAKDEIPVHFTSGPPEVTLLKPVNGSVWYESQLIRFEALTVDPDEAPFPSNKMSWSSSIDGNLGTGYTIEKLLSQGQHTVTVTATDELGLVDMASITVNVQSGAGVPTVQITSPPHGSSVAFNPLPQQFTGMANDAEDGALSGGSLVWTSSIDGFLGTGTTINPVLSGPGPCSSLTHFITLTATDSDNHSVSHQITVTTDYIC